MTTKRDEVREFIRREAKSALGEVVASIAHREQAEIIRANRDSLATQIAWHIAEEYRFLELADIMEWRRTRVRR
jgi:acetylglutamate kinase